jgi:Cd2+/Zn2+-exporting ATPase
MYQLVFVISEALESKCTSRARNALADIICLRTEHANVINPITQNIVVLLATSVAVGSLVRVVVEGKSTIDESTLMGESRSVSKSESMLVSGGTINTGSGMLVVRTTATSDNSAVSRLCLLRYQYNLQSVGCQQTTCSGQLC